MISPVFKGPMSQPLVAQTYTQAGAIAGATAAMQARAAQIQVLLLAFCRHLIRSLACEGVRCVAARALG